MIRVIDNKQQKGLIKTNKYYNDDDGEKIIELGTSDDEMEDIIHDISNCSITLPQNNISLLSNGYSSSINQQSVGLDGSTSSSSSSRKSSIDQIIDAGKNNLDHLDIEIKNLVNAFDALLKMNTFLDIGEEEGENDHMEEDVDLMEDDDNESYYDDDDQSSLDHFYDYITGEDYIEDDLGDDYRNKLLEDINQSFYMLDDHYDDETYDSDEATSSENDKSVSDETYSNHSHHAKIHLYNSGSDGEDDTSPACSICGEQHY